MEVTDSLWQPLKGKAERRRKRPVYAAHRNLSRVERSTGKGLLASGKIVELCHPTETTHRLWSSLKTGLKNLYKVKGRRIDGVRMQRCSFRPGLYLLNVFLINNPLSQFVVR